MAATLAGRRLTEQHRRAQVRLAALTTAQMRELSRLLDPEALTDTTPGWLDAAVRLVVSQHTVSAALARRYFQAFRAVEAGQPMPGSLPQPGIDTEAVRTSLMVTGPTRIERARRRGLPVEQAARRALATAASSATRHVLSGGRDVITQAVAQDRRAIGWARVTSGNPCHFCALLSGRGAGSSAAFEAHDGCNCSSEPIYRRDAPLPGRAAEFADLYARVAQGEPDPLNAFRRAYEGRD